MSNLINELYDSFNTHEFKEAFKGNSKLKLVDHTWGGHDTLLVFNHLLKWLKDGNATQDNLNKIALVFEEIVIDDKSINSISKGLESLKFILSYCIVADDKDYWPLTKSFIEGLITRISTGEELGTSHVCRDIESIKKYL